MHNVFVGANPLWFALPRRGVLGQSGQAQDLPLRAWSGRRG